MKKLAAILIFCFLFLPLTSMAGSKTLQFEWNQQTITQDFAGWTLYHSTDNSTWEKYADIPYSGTEQTSYTSEQSITSPDGEDVTHYFKLTARDDKGNESNASSVVSQAIDLQAPDSPGSFSCEIVTN